VPLTSIQSRIPAEFTNWEIITERDGHEVIFKCWVPENVGGVPHGIDGDLERAIIELYRAAGMPMNGKFFTTPTALMRAAGFPENGEYYLAVQRGLERFRSANYTYIGSWYRKDDPESDGRYTTLSFSMIAGLTFDGKKDTGEVRLFEGSKIEIILSPHIVNSLQNQNILPYDMLFMRSIRRDTARNLYRLLEGRRHQEAEHEGLPAGTAPLTLTMGLLEWAIQCRIYAKRVSLIRRMLDSIHKELKERKYLEDVVYTGRGDATVVCYQFSPVAATPKLDLDDHQERLMTQLRTTGLNEANATTLIRKYKSADIERALETYNRMIENQKYKPRNKAGFFTDILKDPSKYVPTPAGVMTVESTGSSTRMNTEAVKKIKKDTDNLDQQLSERKNSPAGIVEIINENFVALNRGAQKGERLGEPDRVALRAYAEQHPERMIGLHEMLKSAMSYGETPEVTAITTATARQLLRNLISR